MGTHYTENRRALDRPKFWNLYLKPSFDMALHQQRIDARVGLNKDGKPIIRLVWGQDVVQRAFDQETPRYWIKRRRTSLANGGTYTYWRVPRFMYETRLEPEQYVDAWEKTRWAMVGEDGVPIDKGPAPSEYYTFAYLCAEHEAVDPTTGWAACCTRAYYTDRSRCWGLYRPPTEDDLQLISRAVHEMNKQPHRDPYRPLSVAELREAEVTANMQVERAAEEMERYEAAMIADFNKLHGHRLFEGPNSFHDLGR